MIPFRKSSLLTSALIGVLFAQTACAQLEERPNILLIMADDLGYSDVGSYGGEIETPNLDRLAANGVRFSQFRATPMCSTTRVALMSGMSYPAADNGRYDHALPLPTLLQEAGYRSMLSGKWHAGSLNPRSPKVFQRFFGFLGGMTDCYIGGKDWFEGQIAFSDFGDDFDATIALTDKSIEYMAEAVADDVPFFMFVSYQAPHHPLQAREETVNKYLGKYMDGYAAVRDARYARQLELGLVDPKWGKAEAGVEVRRWADLSDDRKRVEDARMSAYAAMVDEMDQGIGRMIEFLEQSRELENTLIVFMSDNGSDYNNGSIHTDEKQVPWLPKNNPTLSNGWAWTKNTPFNYYKHACHEGALTVPFIVHWPKGLQGRAGEIDHASIAVTDIYPTMIELTQAEYPERDTSLRPLTGRSFLQTLTNGTDFEAPTRFLWFNQSRAWIEDDMKAVSLYNGPWQLYDLREDRAELNNLAMEQPARLKELSGAWHAYAESIDMSPVLSVPVDDVQHGWGWHRLKMFAPDLVATVPENSKMAPLNTRALEMHFSKPLDLAGAPDRYIRLYAVSDESTPIWEIDLDAAHPSHGQRRLILEDLPELEPDTQYFVLIDSAAFKVGSRPVNVINDGAYWWRFRTEVN